MKKVLCFCMILLVPATAIATEIPRYDIAKYCNDPNTQLGKYIQATPSGCIAGEKEKLAEIQAEWIVYKPEFLAKCIGSPAVKVYSDLANCLTDQPTSSDID
jgi:hypothetical protein